MHALTRETIYRDLPLGRRARLHAAVGAALVERLPQQPALLAEAAHHHAQAAPYLPDLGPAAVDLGARAARDAQARGAFTEARALWTRTLDVERRLPADHARRHALLLALSAAQERLGEIQGHLATIGEALALARSNGDHRRLAEAATSYRSSGIWHWRELGQVDPAAVAVLEECLTTVQDDRLLARVWSTLGLEHYIALRPEDSDRCGRRAIELARASGDPEVLRDCLVAREIVCWRPGRMEEQIACARESLAVANSAEYEIAARFHLGAALRRSGRTEESDAVLAPAYERAADLRHTGADIPLAWWRWLRAGEREDPDADAVAQQALDLHRRSTVVGLTEVAGLATLDRVPEGDPVPADVVATVLGHPNRGFRAAVAHALCRAGEPARGLEVLGGFEPLGCDYASLYAGALTVAVLAANRHPDLEAAVEEIRPYAAEVAAFGSVTSLGSTMLWIGLGPPRPGPRRRGPLVPGAGGRGQRGGGLPPLGAGGARAPGRRYRTPVSAAQARGQRVRRRSCPQAVSRTARPEEPP